MMPVRPTRVKTQNELGKTRTLPGPEEAFTRTGQGSRHIFLGLGPNPEGLTGRTGQCEDVCFIESPRFWEQMDTNWHERIPPFFQRISPEELTPERLAASTLWIFTPGERLFPSFWGPILARVRMWMKSATPSSRTKRVLLPWSTNALIVPELARAFEQLGFNPMLIPENLSLEQLEDLLVKTSPQMFVSLNMAGLDGYGGHYYLLREAGVAVAVWMVDNPFHLLGSCRGLFWKDIPIGVTDDWFLDPLENLGGRPFHLPLGTDPHFFSPCDQRDDLKRPQVSFVGRTAFPRKQGFFAGASVNKELLAVANKDCLQGKRRDVSWWIDRLAPTELWPGNEIRQAGLGAEETSLAWRQACLEQAAACSDLNIVGDPAWKNHLTRPFTLHPPLDYYGPLGAWYARAAITLNMTSMLLPHGLTQRHFDVWAAGGFLLTDTTPGQAIFPKELCAPISFTAPSELPDLIRKFTPESKEKNDLRNAWQQEITARHTYVHRVQKILDILAK
ncbi:glycosyltransferase family protein [Desulfoplanes sp. PS50]